MIRRSWWIMITATLLLLGCSSGEHEDVKQWMAESSRDLRGSVPPLPELKPFPVVSYGAADQPDPFSPGRIEQEKSDATGGVKPDLDRVKEQLESFPLESLRYKGHVLSKKDRKSHALIQVDQVMYHAVVGNYLGENYGKITEITDSEIKLLETVQDPTGRTRDWVEREQSLQLEEGGQGMEGK